MGFVCTNIRFTKKTLYGIKIFMDASLGKKIHQEFLYRRCYYFKYERAAYTSSNTNISSFELYTIEEEVTKEIIRLENPTANHFGDLVQFKQKD